MRAARARGTFQRAVYVESGREHRGAGPPPHPRPPRAREEAILEARARAGAVAAGRAVMGATIRLVRSTARRYTCKSLTFEDLVQEGIIGLLEAINKFDGNLGNRFST